MGNTISYAMGGKSGSGGGIKMTEEELAAAILRRDQEKMTLQVEADMMAMGATKAWAATQARRQIDSGDYGTNTRRKKPTYAQILHHNNGGEAAERQALAKHHQKTKANARRHIKHNSKKQLKRRGI